MPHRGIEPASAACWSDALASEPHPNNLAHHTHYKVTPLRLLITFTLFLSVHTASASTLVHTSEAEHSPSLAAASFLIYKEINNRRPVPQMTTETADRLLLAAYVKRTSGSWKVTTAGGGGGGGFFPNVYTHSDDPYPVTLSKCYSM